MEPRDYTMPKLHLRVKSLNQNVKAFAGLLMQYMSEKRLGWTRFTEVNTHYV